MNEIVNNILTRRSIRKFTDEEIPEEILNDIMTAAIYAPSGKNCQTWEFTVITNVEKIQNLARLIGEELNRSEYDFYKPTVLIIPSNERESVWGQEDNACALENIFLAAHSYGIGSVWINQMQGLSDKEEIRKELRIMQIPDDHVIYGMAALGYPASKEVSKVTKIGRVTYIK